jgi:ribosomal protein S6
MFLLDNQAVRADWGRAKGAVTDLLAKYGARVQTARRWDERKLAYPIKGRARATYLLCYFEAGAGAVNTMRRDFDLDERVLRYLMLRVEGVPAGELELSQAETAEGFSVPPPPVEEATSAERAVFGDLADRPVQEHGRRSQPEAEEAPAEAQAEPVAEPVAATEES